MILNINSTRGHTGSLLYSKLAVSDTYINVPTSTAIVCQPRCNKLFWLAPVVLYQETTAALRMEGGHSLRTTCSSRIPRTIRLPAVSVDLRRALAVARWNGVAAVPLVQVGMDFCIGELFSVVCLRETTIHMYFLPFSPLETFFHIFPGVVNPFPSRPPLHLYNHVHPFS